jgi:3'(2'), 5'-bisphosphate nucleotidase
MRLNKEDLLQIVAISQEAGKAILEVYQKDFSVDHKEDNTPLTEADLAANHIISSALKILFPTIPIISEEEDIPSYEDRKNWEYCWVVDPLDGTREFIKRNGEFTVNIALLHFQKPVLGVVYVPVEDTVYYALEDIGAFKSIKNIEKSLPNFVSILPNLESWKTFQWNDKLLSILASRSHINEATQDFISTIENNNAKVEYISKGSSIKFCMVAEGAADVYPRYSPTMEWDTAAAHAIVLMCGRDIIDVDTGKTLLYNKEDLRNGSIVCF